MSIWDYFTGNATPEQTAGLTGLAAMFNNALGDGRRPVNLGAALAAGAQGMQMGREAYVDRQQQQDAARQMADLRALQVRSGTAELDAQQRALEQQAAIQQAARESMAGGSFDTNGFIGRVQGIDPLKAIQLQHQLAKAQPKYDSGITWVNGPDGKPVAVRTADDGSIKQLDGLAPRDKAELVNLGGTSVAVNPFDLKPGQSFQRTMTPDGAASNAIARANLGIAQQRLALEQRAQAGGAKAPQGYRWAANGQLEAIPGGPADPKAGKEGVQRTQDASDVLSILNEAEPLLKASTSSYLGAGADQVARAFGASTKGSEAAAQLKVLQGLLVSKMPKMSGPQSDKDVQLYREMAGQIGDATLPESTRKAAANTIRNLNEKYLGMAPGSSRQQTTQPAAPKSVIKGQVMDGYRFKGGNPADPNAWEKI
ncbi:hypothetical protein IP92_05748 [Pseudoduganella flava]|uniref:Uncharacterized protein n=1 Tax=Pseudoduganella flava TaxID=871742 RepID=A0A562P9C8_9BURK|nr:hypothetical protein [Pseudoduganella flava]QGZ42719.1 hypothetical protein GO485_29250 [Pseudoduganella flava]TWI41028.1 hypothetical protein IP92_05748 [Pseudoduganella flava]